MADQPDRDPSQPELVITTDPPNLRRRDGTVFVEDSAQQRLRIQ